MTDIGTIGGDPCSNGFYINARGQVAGTTADCHGHVLHFFVWENGTFTDLGAQVLPGSDFASVELSGINDAGEIIGNGTLLNGDVHAFYRAGRRLRYRLRSSNNCQSEECIHGAADDGHGHDRVI